MPTLVGPKDFLDEILVKKGKFAKTDKTSPVMLAAKKVLVPLTKLEGLQEAEPKDSKEILVSLKLVRHALKIFQESKDVDAWLTTNKDKANAFKSAMVGLTKKVKDAVDEIPGSGDAAEAVQGAADAKGDVALQPKIEAYTKNLTDLTKNITDKNLGFAQEDAQGKIALASKQYDALMQFLKGKDASYPASKAALQKALAAKNQYVATIKNAITAEDKGLNVAEEKKIQAIDAQLGKLREILAVLTDPAKVTADVMEKHPALNKAYTQFSTEVEFSPDNMEFLNTTAPAFFSQVTPATDPKADGIRDLKRAAYEKFIPNSASKQINLVNDKQKALVALAGAGDYLGMNFASARDEIKQMVGRDSLNRFKRTPEFAESLKTAKQQVEQFIASKGKEREAAAK